MQTKMEMLVCMQMKMDAECDCGNAGRYAGDGNICRKREWKCWVVCKDEDAGWYAKDKSEANLCVRGSFDARMVVCERN